DVGAGDVLLLVRLVADQHQCGDGQEQADGGQDVEAQRLDDAEARAGVVAVVAGERERADVMSSIISVVPAARAPARRAFFLSTVPKVSNAGGLRALGVVLRAAGGVLGAPERGPGRDCQVR